MKLKSHFLQRTLAHSVFFKRGNLLIKIIFEKHQNMKKLEENTSTMSSGKFFTVEIWMIAFVLYFVIIVKNFMSN